MGAQLPGEDHIIGPHTFGRKAAHQVEAPNRDLLLEFCESNGLMIANTFLPGLPEAKATFMEPGSAFLGPVCEHKYNMLDIFLCDGVTLNRCSQIASIPGAALGTDHYLVKSIFAFDTPTEGRKARKKFNIDALLQHTCRSEFASVFCEHAGPLPINCDISHCWDTARTAMQTAALTLPPVPEKANNPWISSNTLDLISRRRSARAANEYENEIRLHKEVRASAKKDRTKWLDRMLENGDWTQVRKLRNPRRARCCKLQDCDGKLVESDRWGETMAEYFENCNGE